MWMEVLEALACIVDIEGRATFFAMDRNGGKED
jgi:hypothetical protein